MAVKKPAAKAKPAKKPTQQKTFTLAAVPKGQPGAAPGEPVVLSDATNAFLTKHKGAIQVVADMSTGLRVPRKMTGIDAIDLYLGPGGFPEGRVIEVFGPEASGKSTLCLQIAAAFTQRGETVALIDAEHATDLEYAMKLGIDMRRMLLIQPDSAETGLDMLVDICTSGSAALVIIDSVAALTPQAELDGDMGTNQVGLQARLMGKAMRKIVAAASQHGTIVLFVNQLRSKVGVVFGSPETTPGGNALKFAASIRIDLRTATLIKQGEEDIGRQIKIKFIKNKVGLPWRKATVDLLAGSGFDNASWLLDYSLETGLVVLEGNTFTLGGEKLGVGRGNALRKLRDTPHLLEALRACAGGTP